MTDGDCTFAAHLAANDREHVERLEAIAADLERHARDARWQYPGIASLFDRGALRIRVELARWKRPHPMGETGFGDEDKGEPPVNLARCPSPGGLECRAVAQAVAPLRRENEVLRSNSDHLSSENAALSSQVDSMAMRIESLAEELAKPEDVRLSEVLDALDGRFPIFDSVASRVSAALDEAEEFIGRAGEAERMVEAARRSLSSVAESMTEHAYQELASALESPPRIAGKTAGFDQPGREYTAGDALGLRRDR